HRPSGLTTWASSKRKPEGLGRFGPNPSGFGLGRATSPSAPNPSTLSQTFTSRMIQSSLISL
ncbi:MAG: hypothetical protein WBA44_06495, partial [Mesorhizobium sp.]